MKVLNLKELVKAINCTKIYDGQTEELFNSISTDTRKIKKGDLFFALKGELFDAHNFLEEAVKSGAGALVVSEKMEKKYPVPVLLVKDTLKALQDLASYNRKQFKIPIIGITGSNGKTTTKDMVEAVLSQKFKTLKTQGNFNNEIGLPLTLLELDDSFEVAVIEMGMRGLGEIDLLSKITKPTATIITSIGETHLEGLGSIENIAMAKSEILNHLSKDGVAFFNGEDQWVQKVAEGFAGNKKFYGFNSSFNLWAENAKTLDNEGQVFTVHAGEEKEEIFIPLYGSHNVLNSLAAISVGYQMGLNLADIAGGLKNLKLSAMRLEIIETGKFKIINDAYNASPASVKASLQILKEVGQKKRTIAVLGDMYELGERAKAGHQEVGAAVVREGINKLIAVGNMAKYIVEGARNEGMSSKHLFCCETKDEAREILEEIGRKDDVILLKGSRGMKMEEMIQGRY